MQSLHHGADCFQLIRECLLLFFQQWHTVLCKELCGDIDSEERLNALLIEPDHLLTALNFALLRLILIGAECTAVFLDIVAAEAELLLHFPAACGHLIPLRLNFGDLFFKSFQLQRCLAGGNLFILKCAAECFVLLLHRRALLLHCFQLGFQRFELLLKPDDIAVTEHFLLFIDLADQILLTRTELPDTLINLFKRLLLFGNVRLQRSNLFIGFAAACGNPVKLLLLLCKNLLLLGFAVKRRLLLLGKHLDFQPQCRGFRAEALLG